MLAKIHALYATLRPSEQRVAHEVLTQPRQIVKLSIAALAAQAHVSEPTVMRFCRAVGCSGFQELKLRLVQSLSASLSYSHREVGADDDTVSATDKVLEGAIASLVSVRQSLDHNAMACAVALISQAQRVEIYGLGGAGIVAADAQIKFFRLGISAVAYSDAYQHNISASLLQAGDVVVAISNTGRSRDLLRSVELAVARDVDVIAITASGSPLAHQARVCLAVDNNAGQDCYAPIKARIAHMVVIDALAINVALQRGTAVLERLQQAQTVLADKFVPI